ncbi:MAG: hypothetical protein ACK4OM_06015 [Alphaproteobacteria bacterium]
MTSKKETDKIKHNLKEKFNIKTLNHLSLIEVIKLANSEGDFQSVKEALNLGFNNSKKAVLNFSSVMKTEILEHNILERFNDDITTDLVNSYSSEHLPSLFKELLNSPLTERRIFCIGKIILRSPMLAAKENSLSSKSIMPKLFNINNLQINNAIKKLDYRNIFDCIVINVSTSEVQEYNIRGLKGNLAFKFLFEIVNSQIEHIENIIDNIKNRDLKKYYYLIMLYNCCEYVYPNTAKSEKLINISKALKRNEDFKKFVYSYLRDILKLNSPLLFHVLTSHSYFIELFENSEEYKKDITNFYNNAVLQVINPIFNILAFGNLYPLNDVNPIFNFLDFEKFKDPISLLTSKNYISLLEYPNTKFLKLLKNKISLNKELGEKIFLNCRNINSPNILENYFSLFYNDFLNFEIFNDITKHSDLHYIYKYCASFKNQCLKNIFNIVLLILQYARPVDLLDVLEAYGPRVPDPSWTPKLIEQAVFLYKEINRKAYENFDNEKGLAIWKVNKILKLGNYFNNAFMLGINEEIRKLPNEIIERIFDEDFLTKISRPEFDLLLKVKKRIFENSVNNLKRKLNPAEIKINFLKCLYEELLGFEFGKSLNIDEFVSNCRNSKLNEKFDIGFDKLTKSFYSIEKQKEILFDKTIESMNEILKNCGTSVDEIKFFHTRKLEEQEARKKLNKDFKEYIRT